jgi:hypothetical protein
MSDGDRLPTVSQIPYFSPAKVEKPNVNHSNTVKQGIRGTAGSQ